MRVPRQELRDRHRLAPLPPARGRLQHPRIRDSDTILRYGQHPYSITIYGAGVIGCEYASIFGNLG